MNLLLEDKGRAWLSDYDEIVKYATIRATMEIYQLKTHRSGGLPDAVASIYPSDRGHSESCFVLSSFQGCVTRTIPPVPIIVATTYKYPSQ